MSSATRRALGRVHARYGTGAVLSLLMLVFSAIVAVAYWTTTGGGTASAGAATLPAPTGVTGTPSGGAVNVGFTGVGAPAGLVDGYYVQRYLGAVPSNACGTNPAVPGTWLPAGSAACTDGSVPNGTYTYRVTAVFHTWSSQGAPSANVVVTGDTTAPTQVVTLTSGAGTAYLGGTVVHYRGDVAGSFTLSDSVTDGGSGPASAAFPAIATAGWTHSAETVTTGTGTNPRTYTSSAFSWTVTPTNPTAKTVTGADGAGNTVGTSLTFASDLSAPTGGGLTVNAVAGTTVGSSSYSASGTYTGTSTAYSADTGSGLASSVVTREVGTLSNGVCSAYAAPTTVGTISETNVATGCYRYRITGTDRVTNAAALTTIVMVDRTAPTQVITENGTATHASGTTLWFDGGAASTTTLTSTVTDGESGPRQVIFAAMAAGGWTHTAETVNVGSGSVPTVGYTSSTYSWTAGAGGPGPAAQRTITASDLATNAVATVLTLTSDDVNPTGGATTINGTAASAGGSSSYSSTGTFTGTRTDWTDAGAGIASSTLTREVGTLSNGACSAFGAPTVVAGAVNETGLATGCYRYTLTGTDNVGNVVSVSTVVRVDVAAPTQAITLSGGAGVAALSGTTLHYRPNVAGSFTLNAAVTDGQSGPLDASFPAIATAGWTHNAQTVSAGTGAAPTVTYPSSVFSWTANPSTPAAYIVTGRDVATNSVGTTLTFAPDSTGPTGGALTVDGTAGTPVGAIDHSSTGTYSGTFTNFSADAGAGYAATTLTRAYAATLTNGACGAFAAPTTIGVINETNAAAGCYRYTLTGLDVFGNASVLIVTMQVDKTAPTMVITDTSPNAYYNAGTMYYRGGLASNFTWSAAVTDGGTGPASVAYPAIATAGWTHNAETVTTGTGTVPTITYVSSPYSWTPNPTNPTGTGRTITGADLAGNTVAITPTFVSDNTAPTGGALTVNGTAATGGGSTSNTNATTWTIGTRTDYGADTGSGFLSSVLTREVATWSGTTCGTFGAPTVITGAPAQTAVGGNCYRYVLTGTDRVGNVATLTTTVRTGIVVSSVTLNNGSFTSGTLNRTDTMVVQFSGPIAVSSLCSSWTGDTTNQSVTGDSVVGVTIREGAGAANDYVQVSTSAAACGADFNFGTVTLGSDAYLASTVIQTFRGTGANQSTIAYNAATYTLTIALGINETTPGNDGSNNVNANTIATYTPDAAITGVGGVGITGVGTTANVRQF